MAVVPRDRRVPRAKLLALAAHLLLSGLLVSVALLLMLRCWFPAPLFATDGGGIGLQLLLGVDLVLGPLLTFVVFHPDKPRRTLALDLGAIAFVQLAAYGAGLWSIHSVRVEAVAYQDGVFHAVPAAVFAGQRIEPGSWSALGDAAPYLVDVRLPANADEASGVTAFALMAGLEPYQLQFLYQPLPAAGADVSAAGWSLAALEQAHPAAHRAAQRWLDAHAGVAPAEARFYRIEGYYGSAVLVLDGQRRWRGGFAAALPKLTVSSPSPRS